jgi:hypothetical protein
MEGPQVHVAEFVLGDVGRRVVAAALRFAVAGEVLGAGGYRSRCREVIALESFYHRDGKVTREIRVFSRTLGDPAPAGIPGDVDHRRERPVDAGLRSLQGRDAGTLADDVGVPGRGLADGYRHYGLETVNHVAADEQRNTEAAFLDRDALQLVHRIDVDLVDDRADLSAAQRVAQRFHRRVDPRMDLVHLSDLFRQRHPAEQLGDAVVDACGIAANFCNGRGHSGPQQQAAEHGDTPRPDRPGILTGAVHQYSPRRDWRARQTLVSSGESTPRRPRPHRQFACFMVPDGTAAASISPFLATFDSAVNIVDDGRAMQHYETAPEDRIPFRKKLIYGSGAFVNNLLADSIGRMVIVLNLGLGMNPALAGLLAALPRLTDAITDPLMGYISDNTRTRWGRRRPYIFVGAIAVGIVFALLWQLPPGKSESWYFWVFLFGSFVFYLAYTVFVTPWVALGYELTPDYNERTRLMGTQNFIGQTAYLFTPYLLAIMTSKQWAGDMVEGASRLAIVIGATRNSPSRRVKRRPRRWPATPYSAISWSSSAGLPKR